MRTRSKVLSWLLCFVLLFSMYPQTVFAEDVQDAVLVSETGLCEHHKEHTEQCYIPVTECIHVHTADCYSDGVLPAEGEEKAADACIHECTAENGCMTLALDCPHERGEHDESCGYAPAVEGTPWRPMRR